MIIECTSCQKKFNVPDSAITSAGRLVQCSSCGNQWTQYPLKTKTIIKTDIKISGEPFYSKPGYLAKLVKKSVKKYTGISSEFSTSGGTSDARFVITKCPVVEFGLVGKTMHKVGECVSLSDLKRLTIIYTNILDNYFK